MEVLQGLEKDLDHQGMEGLLGLDLGRVALEILRGLAEGAMEEVAMEEVTMEEATMEEATMGEATMEEATMAEVTMAEVAMEEVTMAEGLLPILEKAEGTEEMEGKEMAGTEAVVLLLLQQRQAARHRLRQRLATRRAPGPTGPP